MDPLGLLGVELVPEGGGGNAHTFAARLDRTARASEPSARGTRAAATITRLSRKAAAAPPKPTKARIEATSGRWHGQRAAAKNAKRALRRR